jgi:hypothetical protein
MRKTRKRDPNEYAFMCARYALAAAEMLRDALEACDSERPSGDLFSVIDALANTVEAIHKEGGGAVMTGKREDMKSETKREGVVCMENPKRKVVVRSDRAGVFYGTVTVVKPLGDKLYVEMDGCRRVHYWNRAASITQIALDGLPKNSGSRVTRPLDGACIAGIIEILPCTEKAIKSMEEYAAWTI